MLCQYCNAPQLAEIARRPALVRSFLDTQVSPMFLTYE